MTFFLQISDAGLTGLEMSGKVEKYERSQESSSNQSEASGAQANNDTVDIPNDLMPIPQEPVQRNPYQISLRSKAEEDIVNDAKRKKIMLHMCEQPLNKEEINCSSYSIARLKGLRSLNLASCNRISDVSLKYSFDFLELEALSLSKCQQITVVGIECLLSKCPSIKILNLSDCHNLTDDAINLISAQLKRLTHLQLERCSQLTDYSLDSIAMNCKRLKSLDIRGCRSMSAEPNLKVENLRSLQRILMSKPGPYMALIKPKPPPIPTSNF